MSLEDAIKLAALSKDIPIENIKQGVIDNSMVLFRQCHSGWCACQCPKTYPGYDTRIAG